MLSGQGVIGIRFKDMELIVVLMIRNERGVSFRSASLTGFACARGGDFRGGGG